MVIKMEIWDLYTENKEKKGLTHVRGEEIPDHLYHLVVHVWIKNKNNKYLISRRSCDRKSYPLYLECPGGSVLKGENSIDGAIREVFEEVGINLNKANGKLVYSKVRKVINNKKFNDILDVWLFETEDDFDLLRATTKEVSECMWLTKEEIRKIYKKKELVPTLDYFFKLEDIT